MNPEGHRDAEAGGETAATEHAQALAVLHAALLRCALEGRFLEALSHGRQALALEPDHADTLHLIGAVHLEAGENELAAEWASRAIRRQPKAEFLSTLGFALSNLGRHDDALKVFDKAVQLESGDARLWSQLGNALLTGKQSAPALQCFARAFELDPRQAETAYRCGHLCHGLQRTSEALAWLDRSLALRPDHAPALLLRSLVLRELKRFDAALADIRQAAALDPDNADIADHLGTLLQELGHAGEACSLYERLLRIRPGDPRLLSNRANALVLLGRREEAMAAYRQALAIAPDFADARWNLGALQLLTGDFANGYAGLEMRWKIPVLVPAYPALPGPMWLGEQPLAGKTILVCADEGLGDSIQYARYLPMLAARGARVVLVVEPILCPLLSAIEGVFECLPKLAHTVLPPFDFHCAINSLPLAFGTTLDSVPHAPYLPPPASDRIQAWERRLIDRLGPRKKLRVGLVWSGNPDHRNDRNRSMSLATLSRILDVDASFISLQKQLRPQDAELLRGRPDIIDLTKDLTDFAETAALLSCLDLVITVDTSVAHVAAGLGRPTWILLPHVPDYRWMLDRDDSPWYPSVRLFRQDATREYDSVLERVRAELVAAAEAFASGEGGAL